MKNIKDPAVADWRAWKRAESAAAHAPMSRWPEAHAAAEEADGLLFHAWPTTPHGAWCLIARAYLARLISEHNAGDGPIDEASSAAYQMKRSLRMLRCKEHSALAPLRDAIPFADAVRVWARVAALSFGGPAGQIAVMHQIIGEALDR
jgi:hypothetical protein